MTVVSIKFKGRGKTYFFDPNGLEVPEGAQVVVETSKGLELAVCVQGNHEVTDERIVPPLRPVARIATPDDLRIAELCPAAVPRIIRFVVAGELYIQERQCRIVPVTPSTGWT